MLELDLFVLARFVARLDGVEDHAAERDVDEDENRQAELREEELRAQMAEVLAEACPRARLAAVGQQEVLVVGRRWKNARRRPVGERIGNVAVLIERDQRSKTGLRGRVRHLNGERLELRREKTEEKVRWHEDQLSRIRSSACDSPRALRTAFRLMAAPKICLHRSCPSSAREDQSFDLYLLDMILIIVIIHHIDRKTVDGG